MALANMTQEETNVYNRNHCKLIAEELDLIAEGHLYKCDYCGALIDVEAYADNEQLYEAIISGDYCTCPECDCETCYEPASVFDWLESALDFDYIINCNREYKAVRILVAFGGPNIYVDTLSGQVELYWWGDKASYPLSNDACAMIDEAMEELYNC